MKKKNNNSKKEDKYVKEFKCYIVFTKWIIGILGCVIILYISSFFLIKNIFIDLNLITYNDFTLYRSHGFFFLIANLIYFITNLYTLNRFY